MTAQPFVIFSDSHLVSLLIIISIAFLLPTIIKNKSQGSKLFITKVIGVSVLFMEVIKPFIWHYSMSFPWATLIPIHMCNLSAIFIGMFLLTKTRLFFEVSFFLGNWWRNKCFIDTRYSKGLSGSSVHLIFCWTWSYDCSDFLCLFKP